MRLPCVGDLCYDFSLLEDYLNDPAVQQRLGVDKKCALHCGQPTCCTACC